MHETLCLLTKIASVFTHHFVQEKLTLLLDLTYGYALVTDRFPGLHWLISETRVRSYDQELISHCYSSCFLVVFVALLLVLVGASSSKIKTTIGSVVSNRIGVKFGTIVLQVNTHRLTESDF